MLLNFIKAIVAFCIRINFANRILMLAQWAKSANK